MKPKRYGVWKEPKDGSCNGTWAWLVYNTQEWAEDFAQNMNRSPRGNHLTYQVRELYEAP